MVDSLIGTSLSYFPNIEAKQQLDQILDRPYHIIRVEDEVQRVLQRLVNKLHGLGPQVPNLRHAKCKAHRSIQATGELLKHLTHLFLPLHLPLLLFLSSLHLFRA